MSDAFTDPEHEAGADDTGSEWERRSYLICASNGEPIYECQVCCVDPDEHLVSAGNRVLRALDRKPIASAE
jgi:hypothetical protein